MEKIYYKNSNRTSGSSNRSNGRSISLLLCLLLLITSCHRKDWDQYAPLTPIDPDQPELVNPGQITINPTLPGQDNPDNPGTPGDPDNPDNPGTPGDPDNPGGTPGTPGTPVEGTQTTITITDEQGNQKPLTPGQPIDAEAGTYTVSAFTSVPDLTTPQHHGTNVIAPPPGTHITPEGILTLPTAPDGRIDNLPIIYAGTTNVSIEPNAAVDLNITQHPMTRPVLVEYILQGIDPTTLKSITVTLQGVAATRSITQPFSRASAGTGIAGASARRIASEGIAGASVRGVAGASEGIAGIAASRAGSTEYYLQQQVSSILNKDIITFRLLGVPQGQTQTLRITVEHNDPATPAAHFQSDVTASFKDFNTGSSTTPVGLRAILHYGISNITGTITNWTPGWEADIPGE